MYNYYRGKQNRPLHRGLRYKKTKQKQKQKQKGARELYWNYFALC